jgi:hypothetical protein
MYNCPTTESWNFGTLLFFHLRISLLFLTVNNYMLPLAYIIPNIFKSSKINRINICISRTSIMEIVSEVSTMSGGPQEKLALGHSM